jgi:uncharacterized membrane protein (UPF0127 family)
MKRWIFLLTLLLLFVTQNGCSQGVETAEVYFRNPDGSESPKLLVEVVRTPGEQKLGLMYRKSLDEHKGMLFVFEEELERSFWMKNTYLELDIIFVNRDYSVVSVSERAVPLSETPRRSAKPAMYVVEVRGGLSKKWGVGSGSSLVLR